MSSPKPGQAHARADCGRGEIAQDPLSRNAALCQGGGLGHLAVDCRSSTASRGCKDRSKPSLLIFTPFCVLPSCL